MKDIEAFVKNENAERRKVSLLPFQHIQQEKIKKSEPYLQDFESGSTFGSAFLEPLDLDPESAFS